MRRKLFAITVFAAFIAAAVALPAQQRETRERGVVVSAATSRDVPVTDMTKADFVVRENGIAREVVSVSQAPPPSHLVVMIDDSQAIAPNEAYLRRAVSAFVAQMAALTPAPQIQFVTFGERPTKRVDFTTNPERILEASKRLFAITGSGAYMLEALVDACKDLKKREAASPVIVAFVHESGAEFSNNLHQEVADSLRTAGASLWVIALQQGAPSTGSTASRERAAVVGDVTRDSGGMEKMILTGQTLEPAFNTLGSLLTSRYLVRYGRPESMIPPDKLEVTSPRIDVKVRAPKWTGK